jgi:hypothetical protein
LLTNGCGSDRPFTSCRAPSEVSLLEQQIVEAHGGISQPEPKHLNPISQQVQAFGHQSYA